MIPVLTQRLIVTRIDKDNVGSVWKSSYYSFLHVLKIYTELFWKLQALARKQELLKKFVALFGCISYLCSYQRKASGTPEVTFKLS